MPSFWEQQVMSGYDFVIVGAGIMGCSIAYELKQKHPGASIAIMERGLLSQGASTKNAGFACFGSPTEILYDIQLNGAQKTYDIITQRIEGLNLLTERLGNERMGKTKDGGYELLMQDTLDIAAIEELNAWLLPVFHQPAFEDRSDKITSFGFASSVKQLIYTRFESQIDSGKMMMHYWRLLQEKGVQIITGAQVMQVGDGMLEITNEHTGVCKIKASKIIVCTNAFVKELLPELHIKPGRGQVLITEEIPSLPFKGSFHFDEGFYYFRNVGNRVLFGGGRNIDMLAEETTAFEPNEEILADLQHKLHTMILPGIHHTIAHSWQGIMGFSSNKTPVIQHVSDTVMYVMSCNGMGVAMSPGIARKAVQDI